MDLAKLSCNGRVYGHDDDGNVKVNPSKQMEDVRFQSYDPEGDVVIIRMDVRQLPDVWMEIRLPLTQLAAWLDTLKEEGSDSQEALDQDPFQGLGAGK